MTSLWVLLTVPVEILADDLCVENIRTLDLLPAFAGIPTMSIDGLLTLGASTPTSHKPIVETSVLAAGVFSLLLYELDAVFVRPGNGS